MKALVTKALFQAMASRYRRIAIVGGPRTGKTTLSQVVTDRPVIATDDFMGAPWEEVPSRVIARAQEAGI